MEILIIAILLVYVVVCGIGMFNGLDLLKWSSWLYGVYGFLTGFLVGFLLVNVRGGLELGALAAFMPMYGGAMTRWHRERFKYKLSRLSQNDTSFRLYWRFMAKMRTLTIAACRITKRFIGKRDTKQ